MNALLRLDRLAAGYGSSQVLFDLSLDVHPGEMATLLGRNGMGKTTTLRSVFARVDLMGGDIRFDGQSLRGQSTESIARRGLALVPEGRRIFPNLSVRENLIAFADRRNTSPQGATAPWTLDRVYAVFPRLQERAHHMGNQLSGGEQQMLAIGRALMTNPKLLILDEATEGLAPLVREEIWRCLKTLRAAGQTLLVVDKYVDQLVRIADRHTIIERGRVAWTGSSAALAADASLWHRYLGV